MIDTPRTSGTHSKLILGMLAALLLLNGFTAFEVLKTKKHGWGPPWPRPEIRQDNYDTEFSPGNIYERLSPELRKSREACLYFEGLAVDHQQHQAVLTRLEAICAKVDCDALP